MANNHSTCKTLAILGFLAFFRTGFAAPPLQDFNYTWNLLDEYRKENWQESLFMVDPGGFYDPVNDKIVIRGGGNGYITDRVLTWNQSNGFNIETPVVGMGPAIHHTRPALFSTPSGIRFHLVGGSFFDALGNLSYYNEVWELFNGNWSLIDRNTPLVLDGSVSDQNTLTEEVLIFGGSRNGRATNELWKYTPGNYDHVLTGGPYPRLYPLFVYDSIRDRYILFGGREEDHRGFITGWLNDTWQWKDQNWTLIDPGFPFNINRPQGRAVGAWGNLFHPDWDGIIFHGGEGPGPKRELWGFDGATWSLLKQVGPSIGSWAAGVMLWDSNRRRVVYYHSCYDDLRATCLFELVRIPKTPTPGTPTPTPTPLFSRTPTATLTPFATATPTVTPSPTAPPTPFPTNTPPGVGKSTLWLQGAYEPGRLTLDARAIWARGLPSPEWHLYIAAEVAGAFYFLPSFAEQPAPLVSFSLPAQWDSGVVRLGEWPVPPPPSPIVLTWYGAFLNAQGELTETGLATSPVLVR